MPGKRTSAKLANLEQYYQEGYASWDIGRPQKSVQRLVRSHKLRGPVLDIGCGTGEHALLLAAQGLAVTGVDFSPTAIRLAQQKGKRSELDVQFVQADFLKWKPAQNERFMTALDVGMFHCLGSGDVGRYLKQVANLLADEGELYLICLAESPHGENSWPHHYGKDELRELFTGAGFKVLAVEETVDESTFSDDGFRAWLLHARRAAGG